MTLQRVAVEHDWDCSRKWSRALFYGSSCIQGRSVVYAWASKRHIMAIGQGMDCIVLLTLWVIAILLLQASTYHVLG